MDEIRVLIMAEDPLARAGLAAILADEPECTIVGRLGHWVELPDVLAVFQPDIVLWDLGWEPDSQPDGASMLEEVQLPILALVADNTQTVDAWTAGAQGVLVREVDTQSLVAALQAVAQGLVTLDQELAAELLPPRDEPSEFLIEDLTSREAEVLQLLAEGLANKTIAHRLDISEHTVKFHVNAILGKLGVQSRTEAVVRAMRLGLITV
jgi:DNA-binding NarL/FixJ family response regulator